MGSTRLPGKVLADIAGRPMLEWVLTRVARSSSVDEVVLATTTLSQDDALQALAGELGVRVVRGDALDVLSRYVLAVGETGADVVVRVTSDCPFIDPGLTTTVVSTLIDADPPIDYVSNALPPRSFPRGLDVEAVTSHALLEADRLDSILGPASTSRRSSPSRTGSGSPPWRMKRISPPCAGRWTPTPTSMWSDGWRTTSTAGTR